MARPFPDAAWTKKALPNAVRDRRQLIVPFGVCGVGLCCVLSGSPLVLMRGINLFLMREPAMLSWELIRLFLKRSCSTRGGTSSIGLKRSGGYRDGGSAPWRLSVF